MVIIYEKLLCHTMKSDNDTGIITNESLTTHCSGVRDYKLISLHPIRLLWNESRHDNEKCHLALQTKFDHSLVLD